MDQDFSLTFFKRSNLFITSLKSTSDLTDIKLTSRKVDQTTAPVVWSTFLDVNLTQTCSVILILCVFGLCLNISQLYRILLVHSFIVLPPFYLIVRLTLTSPVFRTACCLISEGSKLGWDGGATVEVWMVSLFGVFFFLAGCGNGRR